MRPQDLEGFKPVGQNGKLYLTALFYDARAREVGRYDFNYDNPGERRTFAERSHEMLTLGFHVVTRKTTAPQLVLTEPPNAS